MLIIFFVLAIAIATICAFILNKDYHLLIFCRRFKTIDGSPLEQTVARGEGNSIFGNTFDILGLNPERLFNYSRDLAAKLKRSYIQYAVMMPVYCIIDAADAELVLSDNNLITKGPMYKVIQPFLKMGLLTSTGQHWHARRKLLTPAFHFKILEQFLEVFKRESVKFVEVLKKSSSDSKGSCEINLTEVIPRFTLNTICETALGVRLDDCADGDEYRRNISIAEHSFVKRVCDPIMANDTIYEYFGDGQKTRVTLEKLHRFSSNIIEKRRQNFDKDNYIRNAEDLELSGLNTKHRYAMLDTMLLAELDGLIDHAGICEEVDTFMFEGFDTTSMNLIFALTFLANHPEKQQKCYEEITELISNRDDLNNLDGPLLSQLKYVECVIKEAQRLCPSVPSIMRQCEEETKLANNLILPKGTMIIVHIFDIHRNPRYFDQPNDFIPERFLPENSVNRHPYAFVPFSAGRRNCIGQKFAMAEMKTLLVHILSNFELLAVTDPKDFRLLSGVLIRTKNDVFIKIKPRAN